MKKVVLFAMAAIIALTTCAFAQDKATPTEVYDQVNKASEMLTQLGADGLPAFNDPKGEFVWKDSYVFVLDCSKLTLAAHPDKRYVGADATKIIDLKTKAPILKEACSEATAKGLWKAYYWYIPGTKDVARKVSFSIPVVVNGTKYLVGAGVWDAEVDVDKLNAGTK